MPCNPSRRPSVALAPRRCFLLDLPRIFDAQKHNNKPVSKVRVMGMVVSMTRSSSSSSTASQEEEEEMFSYSIMDQEDYMLLELDDGTGTVSCMATVTMVDRLEMQLGQTLDCIGELQLMDTNNQDQQSSSIVLQADTLLEVPRNKNNFDTAERLRWLEITHQDKIGACGYPCPEISSNDIFEIIDSNHHQEGVSVADLALVMDLHPQQVQPLIENLQVQGLIYENETGSYVPL